MKRFLLGLILLSSFSIALSAKEKDDKIEDMMEKVHEGKRSPFRRTKSQLAAAKPDWKEVSDQIPAFQKMSQLLTEARKAEIKDASGGYADAIKALTAAANKQDHDAARKAITLLTASCADCHYKGGPGGKLDDD